MLLYILYNINNPTKPPIVPLVVELNWLTEDITTLIQNNIVNKLYNDYSKVKGIIIKIVWLI